MFGHNWGKFGSTVWSELDWCRWLSRNGEDDGHMMEIWWAYSAVPGAELWVIHKSYKSLELLWYVSMQHAACPTRWTWFASPCLGSCRLLNHQDFHLLLKRMRRQCGHQWCLLWSSRLMHTDAMESLLNNAMCVAWAAGWFQVLLCLISPSQLTNFLISESSTV